jgi:hypothetical protein
LKLKLLLLALLAKKYCSVNHPTCVRRSFVIIVSNPWSIIFKRCQIE